MPKAAAETENAEFWADITARARTTSTPFNTENEAHHANERHDRARKAEATWRGPITPERVAADHAEATEIDEAAAARKKAVRAVIERKRAEAELAAGK